MPEEVEMAEHQRLAARRAEGECVLDLEDPVQKRAYATLREEKVKRSEEARRLLGYSEMYTALGLSEEHAGQFDRHLSQIVRASSEAETAIAQLLRAKSEYRERIKSSIPEDKVSQYLEFEEGIRARHDVSAFSKYLSENQIPATEDVMSGFSALIKESGARTFDSWEGPLDDLPKPAYGNEEVLARLERYLIDVKAGRDSVLRLAADRGISQDVMIPVHGYYSSRLTEIERTIAGAKAWSRATKEDLASLPGLQRPPVTGK